MPTSFVSIEREILTFSSGILGAARLCTSAQVGRHTKLRDRSQPARRAKEFLASRPDVFERIHAVYPYNYVWRLTREYKRAHGITYKRVGASQRLPHWLAFGDLWIDLIQHGYRPSKWFTEGRQIGGFDIYAEIHQVPYLIEMQVTPLSEREWKQKWYQRSAWYEKQPWHKKDWGQQFCSVPPRILLITPTRMKGVKLPRGGVAYITTDNVSSGMMRIERSLHR